MLKSAENFMAGFFGLEWYGGSISNELWGRSRLMADNQDS